MKKAKFIFLVSIVMVIGLTGCGKDKKNSTEAVIYDYEFDENEEFSTTEAPVVEDERFTTIEGADAIGLNFDEGTQGFATYVNGGSFTMYNEGGELVSDIETIGKVDYANQIYYDGFTMANGCVYVVSFDIYSTVERTVEWRVQINGGDYRPYANDYITISPEKTRIEKEFVMSDNSDPAPRFVINMGNFEGMEDVPHKIYVDNLSLIVKDASNAAKIEGAPTPIKVKVNQIGYGIEDKKTVIVTDKTDEKFKIVEADTGKQVYRGEYGEQIFDKTIGSLIKHGDFTDFKNPGKYKIISSPSGESYEFEIGNDLYDEAYKDVIRMLYIQRCGIELTKEYAGNFAHVPCHTEEAIIYGDPSSKTIDVSGGWHDAGDYGRYVVPGAKTVQDLLLAYEDYGVDSDDFNIPESNNDVPDLLDEARFELEWMFKMQEPEFGGVYHKVTCHVFPETILPEEETDQLVVAPISYAATGNFAAVMAKASVSYEKYDKEFAKKCLEVSKKAYEYLEANPDSRTFTNPEEIVTGQYNDPWLVDELLWASSELYIATGEEKYITTINTILQDRYNKGLGWADVGSYGLYSLAMYSKDEALKELAKQVLIEEANVLVEKASKEGFFMSLGVTYPWGSNMTVANNGMTLLMANKLTGQENYMEYAKRCRDYLFGVNGVGYCYVTGYGTLSPNKTHHRPSMVLGETLKGMLVGGANSNLEDPYAAAVLYGYSPSLCYVDNDQSYSCNEITIYWNSPLIYLMSGVK